MFCSVSLHSSKTPETAWTTTDHKIPSTKIPTALQNNAETDVPSTEIPTTALQNNAETDIPSTEIPTTALKNNAETDVPSTEIPTALQNNGETDMSLHPDSVTTNTDQGPEPPYAFKGKMKVVVRAYNIFILIFGIPGNLFAVVVLCRKECQKMSGSIFLITMTLADMLFILVNQFFGLWVLLTFGLNLNYLSDLGCKFLTAFLHFSSDLSKCSLLAFALERYFSICFPLRCKGLISQKLRIRFLILLVTILILFLINDMIFLKLTPGGLMCQHSGSDLLINIQYGFSLVFSLFPGVAMFFFNVSIMIALVRRKKEWDHRQNKGQADNTTVSSFFQYYHFLLGIKLQKIVHTISHIKETTKLAIPFNSVHIRK